MKVVVVRLGTFRYLPIMHANEGINLQWSKLTNSWVNASISPKTFRTRKGAEKFLRDLGYTIDKS